MIEVKIIVEGSAQELVQQKGAADWLEVIRRELGGGVPDEGTVASTCLPFEGEDWRGRKF